MKKIIIFLLLLSVTGCQVKQKNYPQEKKQTTQTQKESEIQWIPCGDSNFIHQPNEKASVKQTLEQLKRTRPELKVLSHGEPYKEDGMGKGWSMQIFIEK